MCATRTPTWKGEKCSSVYFWEDAPSRLFGTGKQAIQISLVRKRDQKKRATKELYVCKWYRTSGVKQTGISGPKFIHREWEILSSIHHPNIVAYEDFSYEPGGAQLARLYLEFCPGGDLSHCMKGITQDNRLCYQETLQVLEQLSQALLYIHHGVSRVGSKVQLASPVPASGSRPVAKDVHAEWTTILHRDIKPANIFISERNANGINVKLGDFGIAKFEADGTDTYVGSQDFMAPEQRTANRYGRRTTTKSDIYALGVTMRQIARLDATFEDPSYRNPTDKERSLLRDLITWLSYDYDARRPGSAIIVDKLQAEQYITKSSATMLSTVVSKILEPSKKRAKMDLSLQLLLGRRLLSAAHDSEESATEVQSLLERAITFMNVSLEALELPLDDEARCPGWKGAIVEDLILMLQQHLAVESSDSDAYLPLARYDIRPHDYQSLEVATGERRKRSLIDVIRARSSSLLEPDNKSSEFLEELGYNELLSLTSSDTFQVSPALHADPSTLGRNHRPALPLLRWSAPRSRSELVAKRETRAPRSWGEMVSRHEMAVKRGKLTTAVDLPNIGRYGEAVGSASETYEEHDPHVRSFLYPSQREELEFTGVQDRPGLTAEEQRQQDADYYHYPLMPSTDSSWYPGFHPWSSLSHGDSTFIRPVRNSNAIRITNDKGEVVSFQKSPLPSDT